MRASSKRFAAGEIVKGIILEVRNKEVLVDIGYKSEGVVSRGEFLNPESLKVGGEIDVLIEKLEDKEGMVILSHEQAEFRQNWDRTSASSACTPHCEHSDPSTAQRIRMTDSLPQ